VIAVSRNEFVIGIGGCHASGGNGFLPDVEVTKAPDLLHTV